MAYTVTGPQGGFERFLVHLRTNTDLERSPGTDAVYSLTVWAIGPYAAHAAAQAWAKEQGEELRHIFGIVEWPRSEGDDV